MAAGEFLEKFDLGRQLDHHHHRFEHRPGSPASHCKASRQRPQHRPRCVHRAAGVHLQSRHRACVDSTVASSNGGARAVFVGCPPGMGIIASTLWVWVRLITETAQPQELVHLATAGDLGHQESCLNHMSWLKWKVVVVYTTFGQHCVWLTEDQEEETKNHQNLKRNHTLIVISGLRRIQRPRLMPGCPQS